MTSHILVVVPDEDETVRGHLILKDISALFKNIVQPTGHDMNSLS